MIPVVTLLAVALISTPMLSFGEFHNITSIVVDMYSINVVELCISVSHVSSASCLQIHMYHCEYVFVLIYGVYLKTHGKQHIERNVFVAINFVSKDTHNTVRTSEHNMAGMC